MTLKQKFLTVIPRQCFKLAQPLEFVLEETKGEERKYSSHE